MVIIKDGYVEYAPFRVDMLDMKIVKLFIDLFFQKKLNWWALVTKN